MFRQMTIALRAGLGFGVVALLVFLLGGFALLQISSMQKEAREVDTRWLPSIVSLGGGQSGVPAPSCGNASVAVDRAG